MLGFGSQEKLLTHQENGCAEVTTCKPVMPEGEDAFIKFKGFEKQIKAPYSIYADFECLTMPMDGCEKNPEDSYTESYQRHEPSGFTIYVVGTGKTPQTFPPFEYRGPNASMKFVEVLGEIEQEILVHIKTNTPMVMTEEDKAKHASATHCHLCHEPLGGEKGITHADHDHRTGQYRGPAHQTCNMEEGKQNTRRYVIPVFFHNLKNYDGHLIIKSVGQYCSKIEVIPQNYEKYISFSYNHLRFLDSAAFLQASLETLAANLYEGGKGKHKFTHSIAHCKDPAKVDLLLQKGVYPYDYMNCWERFEETALPSKDEFYSKLNNEHITDEDYAHAKRVWAEFDIQNLGEYHDLYMTTDVLLLADIFENFRDICLRDYELDPCHYFTLPNFAWECMLKKTGVELELLTDYDQHVMIEQGLRGGISMIAHRHATANNKYVKGHDATKPSSYIAYLDANNLYGHSMLQKLPIADFEWCEDKDIDSLISKYAQGGDMGCFAKVDIEYPAQLHALHNDYPLAPERKLVKTEMLSPYCVETQARLNIGDDTVEKLVPNLQDKTKYVADIRNLAYYKKMGLKITKVHSVITFRQEAWLAPYIDFNTSKRAMAQNEFEKDFYKLMNNACFGKTMENLRNRIDVNFVTNKYESWGHHMTKKNSTIANKLASPYYDGHIIYDEHLAAIKMKKKSITLNKPIYAGMAILDLSKLHMYEFHYGYIKPKYGEKAKLLMTDTDSLCYHVETPDFYQDMQADIHKYDMSNFDYEKLAHFKDNRNKKVVGFFKEEGDGIPWSEFVGLRPKMYSLAYGYWKDGEFIYSDKKTGKGIKRSHLKHHITHGDYVRCIAKEASVKDKQQHCEFNCIRSTKHQIYSQTINKVGLCCYDNKRYILDDGITSLSYGHHAI
jgi:hypothetical protein